MLDNITLNCHSSIRIGGSKVLYFDPFRIGDESHDADVIFVTHDHYDHFEPSSIAKLSKEGTVLVVPDAMRETACAQASEMGIPASLIVTVTPGSDHEVCGISFTAVASYNADKAFHPKSAGWCGYAVTIDGLRCYVVGDADDIPEARQTACDVLLLPIGGTYTMTAEEAAGLANSVRPQYVIPTHYGSIVGSPEDADEFAKFLDPSLTMVRKLFI